MQKFVLTTLQLGLDGGSENLIEKPGQIEDGEFDREATIQSYLIVPRDGSREKLKEPGNFPLWRGAPKERGGCVGTRAPPFIREKLVGVEHGE